MRREGIRGIIYGRENRCIKIQGKKGVDKRHWVCYNRGKGLRLGKNGKAVRHDECFASERIKEYYIYGNNNSIGAISEHKLYNKRQCIGNSGEYNVAWNVVRGSWLLVLQERG